MRRILIPALILAGCSKPDGEHGFGPDRGAPSPFAEPSATPPLRGPGGPAVAFDDDALWVNCATLTGDPDKEYFHHNLVAPYRGHLVLPWSPEFSTGGVSFFDMSDPCSPVKEGEGWDVSMRESHALGFLHLPDDSPQAGDYMVTTGALGIAVWDITDPTDPHVIAYETLPDVVYPDSYARVVLSVSWQHPHLYVAAADNGVYVLDMSAIDSPELVGGYSFDPVLRAGGVFAMGTRLMVSSAEGSRAAVLDISDPTRPQPIPGGLFEATTLAGEPFEAYHANVAGPYFLFARKEGGGGVMVMDVSDPTAPVAAGDINPSGNGGYVFWDEGFIFSGESSIARVYDARSLPELTIVGEAHLPGDLDTFTPYGNVAVLSVDEDAEDQIASAVVPWTAEPDAEPPELMLVVPTDGEQGVALTARVGLGFNEMVEPTSVFPGSVRLWTEDGAPVDGWGTAQENTAHYAPKQPLEPGTTYTLEVMAGGIQDLNGNALSETVTTTFTTAGSP